MMKLCRAQHTRKVKRALSNEVVSREVVVVIVTLYPCGVVVQIKTGKRGKHPWVFVVARIRGITDKLPLRVQLAIHNGSVHWTGKVCEDVRCSSRTHGG